MDIRRQLGAFPRPYIEGFVVIQSGESLDVSAVYTSAAVDASGRPRHRAASTSSRFASAKKRAKGEADVIEGLKTTPSNPTFTLARDAIIVAVSALHSEDLPEVWAGFAKRGMGVDAVSPPAASTTLAGVVEGLTVPP
jgi:Fungalysin metallopeptidase (M36)